MKQRFWEFLNNPWSIALVSGLFLMVAAPLVTGFVQLTFSTKSWPLRANKSETFEWLKFTLEGAGARTHGYAFTATYFGGYRI